MCRRGFVLSLSGAAELPPSFVTTNIFDAYRTYFSPSNRHNTTTYLCELCDTNKHAANYCDDCNRKMCNSCTKVHDKIPVVHEKHFVYSLKDEENSVLYLKEKEKGYLCEHHGYLTEKYCSDCSVNICCECEKTFHAGHSSEKLPCEADDREKMHDLAEEMRQHVLKSRSYVTDLAVSKEDIIKQKERISGQIEEETEYIQQTIISKKNKLLKELDALAISELRNIETEKIEASEKINSLSFMFQTANIFVREANGVSLSAEFISMKKTWENIQTLCKRNSTPKVFGLEFDSTKNIFDETYVIGNVHRKSDKEDDGYEGVDSDKDRADSSTSSIYQVVDFQEDSEDEGIPRNNSIYSFNHGGILCTSINPVLVPKVPNHNMSGKY